VVGQQTNPPGVRGLVRAPVPLLSLARCSVRGGPTAARIPREGAPGAAVFRPGDHSLDGVAPVGEAPVAAGGRRRDSQVEGSAVGGSPVAHRRDRSCGWGNASCWRGVLLARRLADDGRNGGIKTRREPGRCPLAWRDRRAANPSQTRSSQRDTLSASEDPLSLSPEDNLRPVCEGDPLCLFQGMTYGPLRGRGPGSGG